MEDFPPPDEFKPFQKIYPSKIARGKRVNMRRSDNYTIGLKTGSEHEEQKPALTRRTGLLAQARRGMGFVTVLTGTKDNEKHLICYLKVLVAKNKMLWLDM